MLNGIIKKGRGGFYSVIEPDGCEHVLHAKKKFRHKHITPMVGDHVNFTPGSGEELGWVEDIEDRKNMLFRPQVANIDTVCIVMAPVPEADLLLTDKLMNYARMQGIHCVLVINKSDLDLDHNFEKKIKHQYACAEAQILAVSAGTGEGVSELTEKLRSRGLTCFCGQSGVGKSSLLNAIFGLSLETGDISRKIERGKNTTRHVELITKDGLLAIDTPGFSLLENEGEPQDPVFLKDSYPEFAAYEGMCRFSPCYHDSEPGCAVAMAECEGKIVTERLLRYRELLHIERERWKNRYD